MRQEHCFAIVAITLWSAATCLAVEPAILPATVEPVVQLEGTEIRACGIQANFGAMTDRLTVTFQLERRDSSAEFSVEALLADGNNALSSMRIFQQSTLPLVFATSAPTQMGGWLLRMPANNGVVTQFIQELMLQGTRIEVTASDRTEPHHFKIDGPLTQSVRAAYLNCAGDLYRPGE
jgi:hypothetical protein